MPGSNHGRPVIGVGVLVWQGQQLLLGQRISENRANCWQFPGGHLETGETVIECAQREVQEETGLEITAPRHLGFTDLLFEQAGRQYITLLVSADYHSGEAKALEPDKCAGWQWFDYRQLPAPLFLPIKRFMAQHVASPGFISGQDDLYALHCNAPLIQDTPSAVRK